MSYVCEFVGYCEFNPALEILKLIFKWREMDGKEVQLLTGQSRHFKDKLPF